MANRDRIIKTRTIDGDAVDHWMAGGYSCRVCGDYLEDGESTDMCGICENAHAAGWCDLEYTG